MALEKVRSRTMAMHKSEELGEVAAVLFEQISTLTYAPERFNIAIGNKEEESFDIWVTDQKGHEVSKRFMFQVNKSPVVREVFKAWEKEPYIVQDLHGKKLQEWVRYMQEEIGLPFDKARLSEHRYINSVFFSHGCIGITTNEPPETKILELIERFAKVFQQTYVRFLDLQKAEVQAREAQIEVALERVRSRAMAMHHTDELTAVLGVLFDQFDFLGINPVLTHLTLFDEENETFTLRITTGGEKRTIAEQLIDVNAVESWKTSFANWKKSELHALDCIDYPPEMLPAVWEVLDGVMNALPEGQKLFPEDFPNGLYTTQGHCKYGYIGFNHSRRATEEEKEIVIRFAKEFGRLYQRFLDIQKAELQAREAQIEGALERVRSKTMAMHNSEDLEDIVITLFDEVLNLGLDKSIRCGIGILEGHEGMETRSVNSTSDGSLELRVGMLNMTIHPMLVGLKKAWKNGRKGYSYEFTGKDVRTYYEALNNEPEYPFNADLKKLPEQEFHRSFFFSSGILFAFSEAPISDESSKILARFAAVFGQTYRRFLDLKKAEAQAKEAQIEASLERIRARAMAMQGSGELTEVLSVIFEQLKVLKVETVWAHLTLIDLENNEFTYRMTGRNGERILAEQKVPLDASDLWAHIVESFTSPEPDLITRFEVPPASLQEIWDLFDGIFSTVPEGQKVVMEDFPNGVYTTQTYCKFGYLGINYTRKSTDEEANILLRFTNEFTRAYQRFLDLQLAEERAKDAVKQASLDRVRGQIASMRSTQDLERITPLVWNELTTLGIPFIRCGVFIMDEPSEKVQVYLSAPDGHSLGVMTIPFNADKLNGRIRRALAERKGIQKLIGTKCNSLEFMQTMIDLGSGQEPKGIPGGGTTPESLYLHFVPFTQGMLYVGSESFPVAGAD